MTILSVTAVARLAERHVNTYGPTLEAELLHWLERHGVDPERAEQAVSLSPVRGRLVRRTGDDGESLIRRPLDWREAA